MTNIKDLRNLFQFPYRTEKTESFREEDDQLNPCATVPIAPETTVLAAGLIGAAALIVVATVATTMILDN